MIQNQDTPPQFFIVGAQRSGTTLLRLMLNHHPGVAIPEEAAFLMPLLNEAMLLSAHGPAPEQKYRFLQYLSTNDQFLKWKLEIGRLEHIKDETLSWVDVMGEIYSAYAFQQNKAICGDKTPSFLRKLEVIACAFPRAKFVHIARDGRDIYLSMKKRKHPSARSVATSALEWKTKIALIKAFQLGHPGRFLEIRYEDLLADPVICLKKVCAFLGIEYAAEMLDFWKTSREYIDPQHSKLIFSPIDRQNAGKWKDRMTQRDKEIFLFLARNPLAALGYAAGEQVSLGSKFLALGQLVVYLPVRLARVVWIAVYMRIAFALGLKTPAIFYS